MSNNYIGNRLKKFGKELQSSTLKLYKIKVFSLKCSTDLRFRIKIPKFNIFLKKEYSISKKGEGWNIMGNCKFERKKKEIWYWEGQKVHLCKTQAELKSYVIEFFSFLKRVEVGHQKCMFSNLYLEN